MGILQQSCCILRHHTSAHLYIGQSLRKSSSVFDKVAFCGFNKLPVSPDVAERSRHHLIDIRSFWWRLGEKKESRECRNSDISPAQGKGAIHCVDVTRQVQPPRGEFVDIGLHFWPTPSLFRPIIV